MPWMRGRSMRPRVRVGAVNYLNTKPLIYNLEALAPQAELSLDVPSRLADRLAAGDLDVALIPVIEFFRGVGYSVVPDIAIASRGPVLGGAVGIRPPRRRCFLAGGEGARHGKRRGDRSSGSGSVEPRRRFLSPLPGDATSFRPGSGRAGRPHAILRACRADRTCTRRSCV